MESSEEGRPGDGARATVVVTRPLRRAGPMAEAFEARGFDVLTVPTLRIVPPVDRRPLVRAARRIRTFDWVAFTSSAGVEALADAGVERAAVAPGEGPRMAAVGASTARAVQARLGRPPDLTPERDFSAAGLADAFAALPGMAGARVLLPLAAAAANLLPDRLADLGARVERVTAYRSVPPDGSSVDRLKRALAEGALELLTFTSPSTAENLLEAVGPEVLEVPAAVIGPTTAVRARELGYRVVAVPEEHTVQGLVAAASAYLAGGVP